MEDSTKPTKDTSVESSSQESWLTIQISMLRKEILPLIESYRTKAGVLDRALEEAVAEVRGNADLRDLDTGALSEFVLEFVLYKVFVTGAPLWIRSRTDAGNEVPVRLLVAAYAVWRQAEEFAARHNLDAAVAAEILGKATYEVAEGVVRNGWQDREGREIEDAANYLFQTYMNRIFLRVQADGSSVTDRLDSEDWLAERQLSDRGVAMTALESGIFCQELMHCMPPRGQNVAMARFILGYDWSETAEALGISVSAAQKALSVAFKKVRGICLRDSRRINLGMAGVKLPKRKKSRAGFWR
jgi:DNA-directed RNA polymerase specialized sigma24 family protein